MSIDLRLIADLSIQQYLVDKDTGAPLAGGKIFFYQDETRTTYKNVYMISGDPPDYTFVALPNPVILSSVGTVQDNNGNDVTLYYFPFEGSPDISDGTSQLYYVVVQNSTGVPQFTREGWPPNSQIDESQSSNSINYIPNGQFLAHNNLLNNSVTAETTVIAPGGWEMILPSSLNSTNLVKFNAVGYSTNPPQSPSYNTEVICSATSASDTKYLRIKFNDVNKFVNGQTYTFGFNCFSTSSTTLNIYYNKYFGVGGSSFTPAFIDSLTSTTTKTFSAFAFTFGDNTGYSVGTGQTWIAIQIQFPDSTTYDVSFTDFVLTTGDQSESLIEPPNQTNASMLSNAVVGWMDTPDYDGNSLYLPLINTAYGTKWDTSQVGKVHAQVYAATSPTSTSPVPISNDMPCDGTAYTAGNRSTIGIPFSRLQTVLTAACPLNTSTNYNIPLYGTGVNYATTYATSVTTLLRLAVNKNGTSSTAAANGTVTGLTAGSIVTYGASVTGSASLNYTAYSNAANKLLAVGNFTTANAAAGANTSGFTVTTNSIVTGLLAQQYYSLTVTCVAGSSLSNTGGVAKYWTFSNSTINYYMWFFFTNETDPAVGGATSIKVTLNTSYTAQEVSNVVREAMNAYQISTLSFGNVPTQGQYWTFSTNPGSARSFYVWYTIGGAGVDPAPGGTGIVVALNASGETTATATTKTIQAVNAYQYAAPDFRGMFLRGLDAAGTWDLDVTQRWSSISGLSGANLGTFEYEQFLLHYHTVVDKQQAPGSFKGGGTVDIVSENSGTTGGSETRPVNAVVNYIIKY